MPPLVVAPALSAAILPAVVTPIAANLLVVDAPPADNDNAGGQPLNATRNVPAMEMKFEDVENYMVEKPKK